MTTDGKSRVSNSRGPNDTLRGLFIRFSASSLSTRTRAGGCYTMTLFEADFNKRKTRSLFNLTACLRTPKRR